MSGTNIVVTFKGNERYIWIYDDSQVAQCLQSFGRFASDPELSFNWFDAAKTARAVRDRMKVKP